jgi:hypothetical protein
MRYSSLFTAAREKKDDPDACAAVIRAAEAHAGHAQDWGLCAKAWLECLHDTDNANRCLLEAECRFYDNCRELAICAANWVGLLNNPVAAQRCIGKITKMASNAQDWDYCAEFLMNAACNSLAALCLEQAEKFAITPADWQERAEVWRDMLHDEINGSRCAANAKEPRIIRVDSMKPKQFGLIDAAGVDELNPLPVDVLLRDLLQDPSWLRSQAQLPVLLGRRPNGEVVVMDLAKTPHLLIAGDVGTGTVVCLNVLLMSLLSRFPPEELSLFLVDTKGIEFPVYEKLPHLTRPVVSDVNQVLPILRWLVKEMEERSRILTCAECSDFESFNRCVHHLVDLAKNGRSLPLRMPRIVLVIIDLAEIMMSNIKDEFEVLLQRIAKKSQSAGIHIIIATQRPDVDIISAAVQASLPARIAFRVSSSPASNIILGSPGAETLRGRGDMLYRTSGSTPLERIQGAYVSTAAVQQAVECSASQSSRQFDDTGFVVSMDSTIAIPPPDHAHKDGDNPPA